MRHEAVAAGEDGPLVHMRSVTRTFRTTAQPVIALEDVDLDVDAGSFVIVHGRSGSGKTTLLNVMGGLDRPEAGTVRVCGVDLVAADDGELGALRRTDVSYVFQGFGLLPVLSAAENVEVPLRLLRWPPETRRERVAAVLTQVGLQDRSHHRPSQLSGGEQQRVAIARALAAGPRLLIADEPTGQLDSRTGSAIIELLRRLVDGQDLTAVVATHDDRVIDAADHRIELADGHASTFRKQPSPARIVSRQAGGTPGHRRAPAAQPSPADTSPAGASASTSGAPAVPGDGHHEEAGGRGTEEPAAAVGEDVGAIGDPAGAVDEDAAWRPPDQKP